MTEKTKRLTIFFLTVVLLSVLLLASGLSNLQLKEGSAFPGGGGSGGVPGFIPEAAPADTSASPILSQILNLVLLAFLIYVAVRILRLLDITRIARLLLVVIVLLMIANLISHLPGSRPVYVAGESSAATQPASDYPISPLGVPPPRLLQIVLIGFVLGAGFLAIKVLRQTPAPAVEAQLSQEAESAVRAIQFGEDLRNVIARCYLQMTRILQEERSIERSTSMTVREFEATLAAKGFPPVPVRDLSQLFEKVRYSRENLLPEDEKTAVISLNEILQFCRSQRS